MLIYPIALSASESINCITDNIHLNITVNEENNTKNISWLIKVINNESVAISGSGLWQKESDAPDAFSSFDENSAISYKNKRAVFVMGNDQSIYFPACNIQDKL